MILLQNLKQTKNKATKLKLGHKVSLIITSSIRYLKEKNIGLKLGLRRMVEFVRGKSVTNGAIRLNFTLDGIWICRVT